MSWGHKILSLARLPVPPRPHIKFSRPTYSTIFAILLQVLFLVFYKFFYGRALSGSNPLVYMHKIASTRQTGGSLRAISPCYRPASKGAGFLFVQALLSLPLLLAPSRGYITLRRDLHTPSHLIYPGLCHAFLVLLYIFLWFLH